MGVARDSYTTGPVSGRVRASTGAEKIHSALHPEKSWFTVSGRGFDSRHLHHHGHVALVIAMTGARSLDRGPVFPLRSTAATIRAGSLVAVLVGVAPTFR